MGRRAQPHERILRVVCIYDQKPWLNLDEAGDRDPEGIRFRAFLDPGTGRGILAEGTFEVRMYTIERVSTDKVERKLASDWKYHTSEIHTIAKPGMLGDGYYLHLRWFNKDTAGKEIELVVRFMDSAGNTARAGTKRFRVPKYTN